MPQFTITLQDAQKRLTGWSDEQTSVKNALTNNPSLYNSPTLSINAFTFHWNDMAEFLNRILLHNDPNSQNLVPMVSEITRVTGEINAIRFYLGKETLEGSPVAPFACLVGVGVTGFDPQAGVGGDDIIELPLLPGTPPDEHPTGIYDFSYPCPTTCPNIGYGLKDMHGLQTNAGE